MSNVASVKHIEQNIEHQYLLAFVDGDRIGLPIRNIQDVLKLSNFTTVPQAASEIGGIMNLRGHIVTVIDLYSFLNKKTDRKVPPKYSIVVEHKQELYSLIVDNIGDVVTVQDNHKDQAKVKLSAGWKALIKGIHIVEEKVMISINIANLINKLTEKTLIT